jgi:hypothetical protein
MASQTQIAHLSIQYLAEHYLMQVCHSRFQRSQLLQQLQLHLKVEHHQKQIMNSAFVTVHVQKFIGRQTFSLELLDRSSPAFFAELVRQMEYAYAKATDVAVGTALINGGTDGGNRAAITTGALAADFVSDAAVSIYKGTLGFAENIVVSPEQWGNLMGLVDSSNRPIFQQTINPQNAGGTLDSNSSSRKPTRT